MTPSPAGSFGFSTSSCGASEGYGGTTRRGSPHRRWSVAIVAVLAAASLTAQSPQATSKAGSGAKTTKKRQLAHKELEAVIAEQQAQIEAQQALIAQQAGDMEALQKRLDELLVALVALTARLDDVEAQAATAGEVKETELEARLAEIESSVKAKPELPPEAVSAGEFPGSFRIPGSDVAIKIGGMVWTSLVQTIDALGSDDRFLTYSIPVEGTPEAGKGERLSLWAGPSKFNFEVRTPTEVGSMRAFIEGDFAGDNKTFRLRHAYGQFRSFLIGQTWSTFSDPDADHLDIDFEGVNAENVQRQAQVRYHKVLTNGRRIGLAIEYPTASITGGQAVNQVPDLVGRMVWRLPRNGHLQAAAVIRQVRGEFESRPNVVEAVFAWGVSASGVVSVPRWNEADRLIFQVTTGRGVARYINDLNSAGGQDAIFTPEGDLRTLQAFAYFVNYEHAWGTQKLASFELNDLRSSFNWGHVTVRNLQEQADDAYKKTNRLSLNLVWSPIPRVDLGTELLWGRRENKDGASGTARQFQLRARFLF